MAFADWRGLFSGADCVVVGCGPSAAGVAGLCEPLWTIACNRSVQLVRSDFAVCVEPFVSRLWPVMRAAGVPFVFAHICEDRRGRRPHPRIVQFDSKNVLDWFAPERTDRSSELWCAMSPFWAAAVGAWLGFERVGVIGVDLTEDRYPDVRRENAAWQALRNLVIGRTTILNLSRCSRLDILGGHWTDFRPKVRHAITTA